ncbi:cucumber peeling cupredoxin-like [Andrographis paniculata]|uniref:cucumber peeling cupredoxin-like n=1 Tax=Andrographis paniculata TaxID=175694 RepID=UPI0021E6E1F4|nr:cucumber peeling cupredoxin-like [Andrographis paniculata]
MASGLGVIIIAVLAAAAAADVPDQSTHHVVGGDDGWGPALDVTAWLSGRVFRVGDKILFKKSGTDESVVELRGPEEFLKCNLTNPIRMYTEEVSHVALEEEGVRYFVSGNLESCKKGLKFPVSVQSPAAKDWKPQPNPYGPPSPPFDPTPAFWPPPPFHPSAAASLKGASGVVAAGLLIWCMGGVSL